MEDIQYIFRLVEDIQYTFRHQILRVKQNVVLYELCVHCNLGKLRNPKFSCHAFQPVYAPFDRPASQETELCKQATSTQVNMKNVLSAHFKAIPVHSGLFSVEATRFLTFGTVPDF